MTREAAHTPLAARPPSAELRTQFGDIDIYLFDQLLRGRLDTRRRVLDAGCGGGRNLVYLLRHGFECYGADRDASAVSRARERARAVGAESGACGAAANENALERPSTVGRPATDVWDDRVQRAELDALPWDDRSMDAVICSAVLHFADDERHFDRMVTELWRVLAPGGLWFARLASTIGIEQATGPAGRRVQLPDGSTRFVVDEAMIVERTLSLGGRLIDPIKTTVVQGMRAMTTWCAEKTVDRRVSDAGA